MTDTDLDFGSQLGHELRGSSAQFGPPAGLRARVAERERQRQRQRAGARAGALGLAAVTTVGGVAWMQQHRTTGSPVAAQPSRAALGPSPSADRIDAYPVIDWQGTPIAGVDAGYGFHDDDQGWQGAVGVPQPSGAPTSIVGIAVFPVGYDASFASSRPGRVAGVKETAVTDGNTTLSWTVAGHPVTVTGDDADMMYRLVDVVQPIEATPERGGYRLNGPLPAGLVELEAPYHRIAMRTPSLSTNDGTFGVAVHEGSLLTVLAGAGYTRLERIMINGRDGYRSTVGTPAIGLALSTDETLFVYGQDLTMAQLTDIARHVSITDEATWRALYAPAD